MWVEFWERENLAVVETQGIVDVLAGQEAPFGVSGEFAGFLQQAEEISSTFMYLLNQGLQF